MIDTDEVFEFPGRLIGSYNGAKVYSNKICPPDKIYFYTEKNWVVLHDVEIKEDQKDSIKKIMKKTKEKTDDA